MSRLIVRPAEERDLEAVAILIDGFAETHPARTVNRPLTTLRDACFGERRIAEVLIAELAGEPIGFGMWRRSYDLFWAIYGGEALGLYVVPSRRGHGVAAAIVAAMAAAIQRDGGQFLQASYGDDWISLYERVAEGRNERACHVSAERFTTLASLAGRGPREIVRGLPSKPRY